MGSSKPITGRCEVSLGVQSYGPGLLIPRCREAGVFHKMGVFGILLCPEHCASVANSERYVTTWEAGHCGREPAPPADGT